ncbi:uncharacterized protein Dg [Euwallacea similis]|uniref:uncharacterized protein Dg n=1 Tax=Euwallacea similis TaxID=1736056 RepID=UPI00344E2895
MFLQAWKSLLFTLVWKAALCSIREDGFTFDLTDDLEVAQPVQPPRIELTKNHYEAVVGKLFHLPLPNSQNNQGFIAKSLPHWLIFNKKTGTFWGIPLPGDEETLHITVASKDALEQSIIIQVVSNDSSATTRKCNSNEDDTVLTLLLGKNLKAVKPKQRAIAVNNVAKYFRLPYSAFTLKPQYDVDDITDSSVVMAGPGNIQVKSSKSASYLEVLVGCDGRLWESMVPLIHNLKQQAKDGTITEVLRLPLIGWRVKTETRPVGRNKRQAVDDYGSGDYDDDYYEDYEDYNEGDLGDVEGDPPVSKKPVTLPGTTLKTTTSVTITSTTPSSSTHPHRHHHGEAKPSEEYDPDFAETEEESPLIPVESKAVTQLPATTSTKSQPPLDPGPTKFDIPKPSDFDDSDTYDYDAYEDEDDTDDDAIESETIVPEIPKNIGPQITTTTTSTTEREEIKPEVETTITVNTTVPATTIVTSSTTSTTTEIPTTYMIVEDTEPPTFTIANPVVTPEELPTTTEKSTTIILINTTTPQSTTLISSTILTSTSTLPSTTEEEVIIPEIVATTQSSTSMLTEQPTTIEEEQTPKVTTPRQISTTATEEAIVPETVESVDRFIPRNTKPFIEKRLQFKSVTAGKVFRYEIPKNTFQDAEDGYNLTLQVLDRNEQPISKESWLQFNPARRELYGLPLAEDVSNWVYNIRASDKEGAYEQDKLTVQVQQHRLERVINHEFMLNLRIEKPQEYPHYVDWSLKVLRALGRIYATNMSEITVRYINRTSEPVVFIWANDSLPTSYCPRSDIEELFKLLTANDRGDPSRELSVLLAPDLRVKKILSKDLTTCEQQAPPPITPTTNFSPILRNPVDKVNATLGELLVFKVNEDTFYDPEDQDSSALNVTLLTADFGTIPSNNWLQFDSKNWEFYGIPRKTGRTEYFLLCVDSGGLSVKDSLEVVVHPTTKKQYNVEFSMTIGVPFNTFSETAAMQRKFVEKLMEIFEEPTPNNFHFLPFKTKREVNYESTIVYWFNKSLPVETCPNEEIKQLESMLHGDSRSISSRVHRIMSSEFPVSTIKVHPIGNCKAKPQSIPIPEVPVPSEESPRPQAENDMMLTLILPIIIIAIMLFVAFVAACILYRKRKMGKMNMEEDGRQSYGNKGIPVIFQEELEEKPESGTKAPVILKDEKPPLAPPEYSKSGSLKLEDSEPYQPPPPFTRTQDNGRQPRPKPTPTYRKPPPYVPP